jgi:hypothetical protein
MNSGTGGLKIVQNNLTSSKTKDAKQLICLAWVAELSRVFTSMKSMLYLESVL